MKIKRKTASRSPQDGDQAEITSNVKLRGQSWAGIRDLLLPEKKWHYVFHAVVILVALSYWIGSALLLPNATWAEIVMFRPRGDNQLWPIVTALSKLNLGDPTDAVHYGEGTAGAHAIILFPYALSYAVFGKPGYMVADVVITWLYFLAIVLLFRRCRFGKFSSLLLGSMLATYSLQGACAKLGQVAAKFVAAFGQGITEWDFPDLIGFQVFQRRIPRPMVTEILVVLLIAILLKQWHERRMPSLKQGILIGGIMGLLTQGDPYSLAALGLLFLVVMAVTVSAHQWRLPWRFILGLPTGALITGCYFLFQRTREQPDSLARFGLANYPRSQILFLPGYAPLLRVGVVCALCLLIVMVVRRLAWPGTDASTAIPDTKNTGKPLSLLHTLKTGCFETKTAVFLLIMVIAAWIAQPVQLLLLGKGAQIYHYLLYTLPSLYGYAVILLGLLFFRIITPRNIKESLRNFASHPRWPGGVLLAGVLCVEAMLGMEESLDTIFSSSNARQDTQVIWGVFGDQYRANFRALEKEFRTNPQLQQTRTFATINNEVNFLLTAFYDKRAFLPDNAYTTLSDDELEVRLCEVGKLFGLSPDDFGVFIANHIVMNYWLGCAKYWFATDYKFSPDADYNASFIAELRQMKKQLSFSLSLPNSERDRLVKKYASIVSRATEVDTYPDVFILTAVLKNSGVIPYPRIYTEIYTNAVFHVYTKKAEFYQARAFMAQTNAVPSLK